MKLATTLMLALSVALVASAAAYSSDTMRPVRKHWMHTHRAHAPMAVRAWVHPGVIALAPAIAIAPIAPAAPHDSDNDGLSRNSDDCNRGCIDNN